MAYHYIITPFAEMRASPELSSEVVSQALFSECVEFLEENNGMMRISTPLDHYQGWIPKDSLCQRATPFIGDDQKVVVNRCAAHLYRCKDTVYGPWITLPFESRLAVRSQPKPPNSRWIEVSLPDEQTGFIQRGDVATSLPLITLSEVCDFSLRFLGLPYTWGGRSSFGYDCSGFIQMLYRLMGVYLPRDSSVQCAWSGLKPASLSELQPADLLFFGARPEKISHVGLHLAHGRFIHTVATCGNTPYVCISKLNDNIWNGSGYYPYATARRLSLG